MERSSPYSHPSLAAQAPPVPGRYQDPLPASRFLQLFLGLHIFLGSNRQNRAKKQAARAAAIESQTTSYGRPLVKGT